MAHLLLMRLIPDGHAIERGGFAPFGIRFARAASNALIYTVILGSENNLWI
jgi:hypothetical protein